MRKFVSILMALTIASSLSLVSFANDLSNEVNPTMSDDAIKVTLSNENNPVEPMPLGGSETFVTVDSDNGINYHKFVRYLTPAWAHSSDYSKTWTVSASMSYSGGLSYEFAKAGAIELGYSSQLSIEDSVSQNIPADSSRYSKLAEFADFYDMDITVSKYYYDLGSEIVKSGNINFPTGEIYLDVVYQ